ncbi:hypothetical protein SDC9_123530 [bioreactor metagenome]|uniref:Fido domain-containing protein n=1 Tax=bioreactor metagenome TaxID=1076179 RepID=A0A645CI80_9ZZZZ
MYMSAKEAAEKWGISERRVRILCAEGRVDGVLRTSWAWNIPSDTPKPADGRQLRHMKNHDMRIGGMDFSRLDSESDKLLHLSSASSFLAAYRHLASRCVLSLFASEDIIIRTQELAVLFNQCFVDDLQFEIQMLALNMRSFLLRLPHQYGLGPIQGKHHPQQMSEQRLSAIYQVLMQGLEEDMPFIYRSVEVSPDHKTPSIKEQMETLFVQYDRDWKDLHPVVRALFLYGELLRIRPYGRYDGLLAGLAFAQELICGGFPPALVDVEHIDEFKAAMILTRSRGNYQNAMRMIEQMLLYECAVLAQGE